LGESGIAVNFSSYHLKPNPFRYFQGTVTVQLPVPSSDATIPYQELAQPLRVQSQPVATIVIVN